LKHKRLNVLLLLDFGNTVLKYFVLNADQFIAEGRIDPTDFWSEIQKIFNRFPKIHQTVASDVRGLLDEKEWVKYFQSPLLLMHAQSLQLPFKTTYTTPATLGQDRIALLAAGQEQFQNNPFLLIDLGTCITYDFMDASQVHHGGAISPGFAMRYRALHQQTGKLPLLDFEVSNSPTGTSTNEAIHAGVFYGILSEIEGQIAYYTKIAPTLTVILSGGDAQKLSEKIKKAIFAQPNFLALGLYKIWTLNKVL